MFAFCALILLVDHQDCCLNFTKPTVALSRNLHMYDAAYFYFINPNT